MKIETGIGHCWITFDNGYTLSIFNGTGSYSENHSDFKKMADIMKNKDILATYESKDVEIAILKDGKFVTSKVLEDHDDDVKGYVSIEEVIEIINKLKEM